MLPTRFSNLPAARASFGDRIDRLGTYFDRVDDSADAVIASLEQVGLKRGWLMVEAALRDGIRGASGAPPALVQLFEQVDQVPVWLDWDAVRLGGEMLLRAGLLGGITLGVKSLVSGYASPAGNKPLVLSGRLQDQALRRLNETARFVQAVAQPEGLTRRGDGFAITLKVRLMHAQVRRMILATGRWEPGEWGAPINQHDMAGTTLLFSHSVLEGLRTLGLRISHEEAECYTHLWRYVGYLIGVDPEILPASEMDARGLADMIRMTMGEPDDDSRALVRALLRTPADAYGVQGNRLIGQEQVEFAHGMCRGLIGDELADKLGVAHNRYRLAAPVFRRIVSRTELIRQNVPGARRASIAVGRRYWARVVELGLAGATAEFGLPEKLARAAA